MTNAEKFRKVFGLPSGIEPLPYVCDIVECEKVKCGDCPMYEEDIGFWDKEYKKPESEEENE